MSPEESSCQASPKESVPGDGLDGHQIASGSAAAHRLLDRAVEAVVVDEIAVAVAARFLEPVQRADQFVVAAPERDRGMRAEPADLIVDLGAHFGEEVRRRGIEIAGEHEVLPDQQAELVAEIVEEILLVEAAAPDADHVHVGVDRGAASSLRVSSGVARDGSASAGIQLAPRQKISRPLTRKAKRAPASSGVGQQLEPAQADAAANRVAVADDLERVERLLAGAGRPPQVAGARCRSARRGRVSPAAIAASSRRSWPAKRMVSGTVPASRPNSVTATRPTPSRRHDAAARSAHARCAPAASACSAIVP